MPKNIVPNQLDILNAIKIEDLKHSAKYYQRKMVQFALLSFVPYLVTIAALIVGMVYISNSDSNYSLIGNEGAYLIIGIGVFLYAVNLEKVVKVISFVSYVNLHKAELVKKRDANA